jgi:hypothetical protein
MSTVKSKKLQVGTDASASNNFTIYQPATPDGTLRIGVGNADNPTEVARVNSDGLADANGQKLSNTPAFSVRLGASDQALSETTLTKIAFDTVIFDTDNAFDNTTNYRFTVPVGKAGKYQINLQVRCNSESNSNLLLSQVILYKNDEAYSVAYDYLANSYARAMSSYIMTVLDLAEGDYVEAYAYINSVDNTGGVVDYGGYTGFSGYKLIT